MNQPIKALFFAVIPALALTSCQAANSWQVVRPERSVSQVDWTNEELRQTLAMRTLTSDDNASLHIVRLQGAEKPHVHDEHDGVVFILKGKILIHIGDRSVKIGKGDLIEIPRGVPHWGESIGGPCEAYVVFRPAYDGKDIRVVSE